MNFKETIANFTCVDQFCFDNASFSPCAARTDSQNGLFDTLIGNRARGATSGERPDQFFGDPKRQKPVRDLSRQEMLAYLIKLRVMSHYQGVERVFWYNYKGRGPNRDNSEDHFGLIDCWGYPKPA